MNICLFEKEELNKPFKKNDERAKHIINILHKKEGDTFFAGIINGNAGYAKIEKIQNGEVYFSFTESESYKKLFPLALIIGFPRPIQLKRLLRDIVSLGVCKIYLTGTELGEKSYLHSSLAKESETYKMILDGAVQAGSTYIPTLEIYKTLKECLYSVNNYLESKEQKTKIKIALDNVNTNISLTQFLNKNNMKDTFIVGAIGSERGWTDAERNLLEKNNYTRSKMGERILRTETAATVSTTLILNALGML